MSKTTNIQPLNHSKKYIKKKKKRGNLNLDITLYEVYNFLLKIYNNFFFNLQVDS